MPTELRFYVVGAGGHARVVMDACMLDPAIGAPLRFADDDARFKGVSVLGCPVDVPIADVVRAGDRYHVAIGINHVRETIHARLLSLGAQPVSVVHPRACVSAHSQIGAGSFVAACAIVAPGAELEIGVIVNHAAVIDHDCVVGRFCHVAPSASLGGNVRLGHRVLVGAGARVLPGLTVGDGAVIGAGAVVVQDVPAGVVVTGIPARQQREVVN